VTQSVTSLTPTPSVGVIEKIGAHSAPE
jgi:hypothetical protein